MWYVQGLVHNHSVIVCALIGKSMIKQCLLENVTASWKAACPDGHQVEYKPAMSPWHKEGKWDSGIHYLQY